MSFVVATWNIQWQFGEWQQRQPAILETLRSLDADIITLQETWLDQIDGFAAELDFESTWAGRPPREATNPTGFGNAILSRWPISRREHCFLEDGQGRKYRSCVHALVESPFGSVPVFTTHLHYPEDGSAVRQMQLATASEFIELHATGELPPVLTGDLNAVHDSDEIRTLTGRRPPFVEGRTWTDAWETAGDGPGFTWSRDNPYLQNTGWPDRRLDYVLIGAPRTKRPIGNPARADLFGIDPVGDVVGSDHYGVAVEIVS